MTAKAATISTVSLSGMGSHGTMSIGGKTKSGTWWKMYVGGKEAFCLTLGATCHAGNTYEVTEKCNWDQDTGGEKRGYYAKIFKWYVVNCKRSKKSFIMSQALLWSAAEGHTSEKQFKNVIKQVKDNTGYYSSNVDSSDDTEFSMTGVTRDDGTIAFRMTYYLQSYNEVYYYPDEQLAAMSDSEWKAAKKHLTDDLELEISSAWNMDYLS